MNIINPEILKKMNLKANELVRFFPHNSLEFVDLPLPGIAGASIKAVLGFAQNAAELETVFPTLLKEANKHSATLWIAYPKKTSSLSSDLNRDSGWEILARSKLRINGLISLNDIWSAARTGSAAKPSSFGKDPEGVDRKTKTVIPPEDLKKILLQNPALNQKWESLSFSHKREYVASILDARRPETRMKRIERLIHALS